MKAFRGLSLTFTDLLEVVPCRLLEQAMLIH